MPTAGEQPSTADHLQVTVDDRGVATVTIDRPPVNALSIPLLHGIAELFARLASNDDLRAVVLRATGSHFCAGIDLKEKASDSGDEARIDAGMAMQNAITELPVPSICAVQGAALGGGFALALYCDLVVASDDARLGFTDINVGMVGGASLAMRYLPLHVARRLLFTAEPLDAARALQVGVVDEVVTRDDLWGKADDLARTIAEKPPGAVRILKELLVAGESLDWHSAFRLEHRVLRGYVRDRESRQATSDFVSG